jgi:hypothetical protein
MPMYGLPEYSAQPFLRGFFTYAMKADKKLPAMQRKRLLLMAGSFF